MWVWADSARLAQAFSNLIHNSVKFSDGPNEIMVALDVAGSAAEANVTIRDRGIGMSGETLQRIFEPFNQADNSLERSRGGLGLGLALTKGLVELHEGELHASSSPGEGTVMTVLLPINGPETKVEETGSVTPLHREPAQQQMPTWSADERKRAL